VSVGVLRAALAAKLPDYLLPSAIVVLEQLPLTPTGKIDRRALPAPEMLRPEPEQAFVAPRDALELQLAQIWEEVLGVQPIGVTDNFFDLGGHSLQAMRVFAQIGQKISKKIPLTTLFQAPTILGLAKLLRTENWSPPWSSLVPIQPRGSRLPFFCVPPAASTVLIFASLAQHLGPEQPFYGLQPVGMDGRQPPHRRVEDMAAHYLGEIRALQPEGPYFLGGMCFGAIVAFEMAQQLHRQGQQVALLAILDTWSPSQNSLAYYARRVVHHWQRKQLLSVLAKKFDYLLRGIKLSARAYTPEDVLDKRVQQVSEVHRVARNAYRAQVYPGKITLFLCDAGAVEDRRADWAKSTTEQLEVHMVSGRHAHEPGISYIREPHVRVLAEKLKACLERAWPPSVSGSHLSQQDVSL
jgi:aspartate racemase